MHAIAAAAEPLERRLCLSAASLTPLGFLPGHSWWSEASGVSGDGSVVVGTSASTTHTQPFYWTAGGGMVGLGDLYPGPGGGSTSGLHGVSADGSVIVGESRSGSGSVSQAFRWTSGGGMVGLGHLLGGIDSGANGVSADGSVIVGASGSGSGTEAFRWTASGGMQGLGDLPGGSFYSSAGGISADGSVIVGQGNSASGYEAFRWTSDGGIVGLGDLPGGEVHSSARGVSADGSMIVGVGISASGAEAFRWTSGGGMVGLGHLLPIGSFGSDAYDVSADGSVIVGSSNDIAFRWTAASGMERLWDVLLADGVNPAADGWTALGWALGISADGNTVIGHGTRNGNTEAFVATLGAPETVASAFQFNDLPHRIVTTFDQNVSGSLGTDDLLIENLTTQQTIPSSDLALAYDAATNTATFSYTGNASGNTGVLPDGNYRATLLAAGITGPGGTPMAQDHILNFFFLNGDANRDGRVNLSDFNILAANFGESNRTFSQGDFNYDGRVNLQDFNLLASRFGVSVAAAGTGAAFDDDDHREDGGDDELVA